MKKIVLAIGFLGAVSLHTNAQIQKGNLMVGASISDISLKMQGNRTDFAFNLNPKVGYFVEDNWAVGGELKLGLGFNNAQNNFDYGIGAFGRYYFGEAKTIVLQHARFFAEANAGVMGTNVHVKNPSTKYATNGLGIGFGPGIAYFITPNISLEALLKYNLGLGFGANSTPSTNQFGLGLGFQIYIPNKNAKKVYEEAADELRKKRGDKYPVETFE